MKKTFFLLLAAVFVSAGASDVSRWEAELKKPDPVLRGRAVRALAELKTPESEALLKKTAMTSPDPLTRKNAFTVLALRYPPAKIKDLYGAALKDSCVPLRLSAVSFLAAKKPAPGSAEAELIRLTAGDTEPQVREIYIRTSWPFYRKNVLLKDRPDWDHDVAVRAQHPLPVNGWKFAQDPKLQGHTVKVPWFSPEFKDGEWRDISIGKYWDDFKIRHTGVAWYRLTFQAPPKPAKFNAAELHFGAVDEVGWVWLNGVYIGDHNLGTAGWNIPFALDITKEIRWNAPNQITVRVYNKTGAGGIWKDVVLKVME